MKQPARTFFNEKLKKLGEKTGTLEKRIFTRPDLHDALLQGKIKKVHITGVCGKATSSLAGLFTESGFEVSGSDVGCYPPASDLIDALNIKFYEGFSEENLKDKDLIIIANMFGPDNEEAAYTREKFLPQLSMPEAITEFFIKDRVSIVVAGTHGKTTTTGFAAHVFLSAKKNPGFLVGGVAVPTEEGIKETSFAAAVKKDDQGQSLQQSPSKHFIIEGDEYDTSYFDKSPKFLLYKPKIAIVTSLEFDHADIYSDFEEYKQSFIFLAQEMPQDGLFILNGDSEEVKSLAQYSEAPVLYYGFNSNSDITATNISVDEDGQHFNIIYKGQDIGRYTITLFGRYNIANALAVAATALHEKLSTDELRLGLKTFLGMKRRQEIRAVIGGVTIIDDFAHHPTAVKETLGGIRERFPTRKIIALFEPRSVTSRKKMFEHPYGKAFGSVNALYLSMPALRHEDKLEDFIDGNVVIADSIVLSEKNGRDFNAICVSNGDEALEKLVPELKEGDVVVIMSNGSFEGVHEKLMTALRNRA